MLQTNACMQKLNLPRELQTATMVYKSLNGLAPDYLKSMFTDRRSTSTYSLRNCEGKLAIPLPCTNFLKKKSTIVVRCCGTAHLPICGKHKRLLVLNPALGVSFLIMIELITRHSWKAGTLLLFLSSLSLDSLVVD